MGESSGDGVFCAGFGLLVSELLHFWVKEAWMSKERVFVLVGCDIALDRKHGNYLPGVEPLRPSALAEQICAANLRSLCAATRATERERPCEDRSTLTASIYILQQKRNTFPLFKFVKIGYT